MPSKDSKSPMTKSHGTDLRKDGTTKETGVTQCLHGFMGVLRESRLPFTSVRMDCSIRLKTRLPCPSRKHIATVVGLRSGSGGRYAWAFLLASSVSCKLSEPSANVVICVGQRERKWDTVGYQSFFRFLALQKFRILVYGNPNQSAFLDVVRTASKRWTARSSPQYFQSRYTTVVRSVIYKAMRAYQYHHLAVNSRCCFLLFDNSLLILNKQPYRRNDFRSDYI